MKELFEFRINYEYANRLFSPEEGKDLGQITRSVKVVKLSKDDHRFASIPLVDSEVREKYGRPFYYSWRIERKYVSGELDAATLFTFKIQSTFEPAGEECGTEYDESTACEYCGSNRKQVSPLKLKKNSIPKRDISWTIAGEIVVSEKFIEAFNRHNLSGLSLEKIILDKGPLNIYQPKLTSPELELTKNTTAGIDPFNLADREGAEIYKCPKGHTLGLNLLSEAYVNTSPSIGKYDFFFATKQKIGVKRGLLRPQPVYLCSHAFRQMIEREKLTGCSFEVAHVEK